MLTDFRIFLVHVGKHTPSVLFPVRFICVRSIFSSLLTCVRFLIWEYITQKVWLDIPHGVCPLTRDKQSVWHISYLSGLCWPNLYYRVQYPSIFDSIRWVYHKDQLCLTALDLLILSCTNFASTSLFYNTPTRNLHMQNLVLPWIVLYAKSRPLNATIVSHPNNGAKT